MNAGNKERCHKQRASTLKTWSQIIGVACVFLIILPRCAGCKSPVDRFWEKKQKNDLEEFMRNEPKMREMQKKLDEEIQETIRKSNG
ncbi:MAG: hypothetical protein AAF491_00020 [Verrucomicrobiota bacterium]